MTSNFVLGSKKSSTYPRGYASGFFSPAASLDAILSSLLNGTSTLKKLKARTYLEAMSAVSLIGSG
jgi:hypothetical protein